MADKRGNLLFNSVEITGTEIRLRKDGVALAVLFIDVLVTLEQGDSVIFDLKQGIMGVDFG